MRYREIIAEDIRLDILHKVVNSDLRTLRALFQKYDRDIRIVGGAVRDILKGQSPKDIDLCTNADPSEQIRIYQAAGLRYIETGLAHGTISVVMNGEPYEITSLRTESEHDGRHATVAYTHDWIEDLKRRDLTVNAMALTFDGELIDPFGGEHDLSRGIIKFVGRATDRIQEDFLRILRFFRFHGRVQNDGMFDVETEKAIREKAPGLERISGERIWSEVAKILAGPNGPEEIRKMCELSVAKHIGLPCKNIDVLRKAYLHSKNPVTLLAAILDTPEEVEAIVSRWKLNRTETDLALFLVEHKTKPLDLTGLQDLVIAGIPPAIVTELALLHGQKGEALNIAHWQIPVFPVSGRDLMALGLEPGPQIGQILRDLKQKWVKSRFTLDKATLLAPVINNSRIK